MIFQRKNLFLSSILLSLCLLLAACGGGNHDISSQTSSKSPEVFQSAPESAELILNGPRSNYVLTNSGDEFIVSDKTGKEGTISARGKTSIKFTDVSINLLVEKKSKTIAEKDLNTLVELYVAFFNRVPDADGMSYWIDQIKAGMTVDQLANNFYNAAIQYTEVTHYSANMTSADFVKIIYKNVLGRTGETAPSNEEVNYWASELDSGRFSKGRLVVTMLHSAHTFAGDAKWGWVPQLLDNKVNVGKYFAIEQGLNFNTPQESITQGVAIAAAISPTDVSKAKEQIPAPDKNFSLSKSISSVALTPNYTNIDQGITQSYQLIGTYTDGSTQALSSTNWSSSNPGVASVSGSGTAKGIAPGVTNISAAYGSKSASASLVVSGAKLNSITLKPTITAIIAGASQGLTATGFYTDGTSAELAANAQWTSSNPNIATVSGTGIVKGIAPGTTKISVTNGSISAVADVTVIAALESITISPSTATIAQGFSQQFTATAHYSDGTSAFVTPVWSVNNPFAAYISSSGLATTGMSLGATTIIATVNGVSASANLTITAATISSIKLSTLYQDSLTVGVNQTLTATAAMSYGSDQDITKTAVWTSSNTAVATVTAGVITPLSAGTTKISATSGGQTASYSLVVKAAIPTIRSITISPATASIALGFSQQFTATATYSDGTSAVVTPVWTSNNSFAASINSSGLAKSSMSTGATTIVATINGVSATANLTITDATISSIKLSTLYQDSLTVGVNQTLTATAAMSYGSDQDITKTAVWTSSNTAVATVTAGVVIPLSAGTTKISATSGGQIASYSLVVNAAIPTIQSITISPAIASIALGFSQQFTATATYSDGSSAVVTPVWTSNNSFAASINSSGLAKSSMSTGATTIVATLNGVSASASLTIADAVITRIKLSTPSKSSFPVGVVQSLTANASMSDGWSKDVTKTVVWTSSNSAVATVAGGVVTPLSVGTANISATANGQSASYGFVVNAATPTSLGIGGPNAGPDSMQPNNFSQGSSVNLRLGVFFTDGSYFTSVGGTWASSDTSKVTVNNAGVFSAIAPGTVTLSASFGGLTAKRNITIATPVSTPSILITCNTASPMTISAATWNAAYASDPTNLTKWLDVDWASCNSRVGVKLVDVKSNYLMFEAITSTNSVFSPGQVYSTGRTPQLTAGDIIRIGYSDSLGWTYYTLYSITVKP